MFKKIAWLFFVLVFSTSLSAGNDATSPSAKDEAGYLLLDKIITGFKTMAEKGSGGYESVNTLLQEAMAEAKAARAQGKIDAPFFNRYRRLLVVAKLAIIDTPYDREGLLDEFIVREINSFIDDVTGERGTLEATGENKRGIGSIAGAMAEELINLHIYLDGQKNRPEILKKFGMK
ncbi:MAG: hypothetical protein OEW18_02590 [Candidatus Aminicenantes bacterium]|nr:hypothetical protein [Candidatus Aminicenantes bacterium]